MSVGRFTKDSQRTWRNDVSKTRSKTRDCRSACPASSIPTTSLYLIQKTMSEPGRCLLNLSMYAFVVITMYVTERFFHA